MAVFWSSPELAGRFRPHIAELRKFFDRQGLHFGGAEDIIPLVERLNGPDLFAVDLATLIRSIIAREGDNVVRADLLEMVAVAIGGPRIDEAAQEFQQPVRQLYSFLTGVLRMPPTGALSGPPPNPLSNPLPGPLPSFPTSRQPAPPPEFSAGPPAPATDRRAPSQETFVPRKEPAAPPIPSSSKVISDLVLQDMVYSRVRRDRAALEQPQAPPQATPPSAPPPTPTTAPAASDAAPPPEPPAAPAAPPIEPAATPAAYDPTLQPAPAPPFEAAAIPTPEHILNAAVLTPEPTLDDADEEEEEDDLPTWAAHVSGSNIYVMPKPAYADTPEPGHSSAADFTLEPLIDFLREANPEPKPEVAPEPEVEPESEPEPSPALAPALTAAPTPEFAPILSPTPAREPAASASPLTAAVVPRQPPSATAAVASVLTALSPTPSKSPSTRRWLIAGAGAALLAAALLFAFGLRFDPAAKDQRPSAAAPATPAAADAYPTVRTIDPPAATSQTAGRSAPVASTSASPAAVAASPARPSRHDSSASPSPRSQRFSRSTEIIAKPYSTPIPSQAAPPGPGPQGASDGVAYPTVRTIDPPAATSQTAGGSASVAAPIVRLANADAAHAGGAPAAGSRVALEPYKDSPGGRVGRANSMVDSSPAAFSGRFPTVGSGVMAGNLLSAPLPNYPTMARIARVQGQVVLEAVISTSGTVSATRVLRGPRLLRGAAVDAVRRWRYKPYLVNGSPVDVATIVTVDFNSNDQ